MASSRSLPVRQQKARIVDKVQLNRVTLIIASTGSGKSSQVPQMLLEEGFTPLLCTQPRRLAVVAISKVVAKERGCQLGEEVGYHIGQKKVISPRSKIIFETAGVLLEELRCEGGKVLSRYKVIILDEVHERSIESDLTLTCIKQFMLRNGNIRLVLMSATFDCNLYRDYFKDLDRGERVEIIPVSNSAADSHSVQFKCELNYLEEVIAILDVKRADRLDLESSFASFKEANDLGKHIQQMITDLVTHLHRNEEDLKKNILIFLPTYKALEQQWSLLKRKGLNMKVFVLHSSIDMDHSIQAMEVSLPFRKVILATNVAESSVTIPGISYVIDSCRSLEIYWNNERKKRIPRLVWVSKSQANQRKGRTGRTCDGQVFRMVPKDLYNSFTEFERPAIQLLSLREQVLTISCAESKAINDPTVLFSKSLDPPNDLTIQNALDTLKSVQALKSSQQRGKYFPTGYGKLLASLPLSLESAILVVKGGQLGLLRETAVLAALMDSSPFPIVHPFGHETEYQTYLERYYQRQASAYGETSKFSHVSILLANLHAFEFWQCTMKDKQRLERLMKYASHLKSTNSDEFVFSEIGEQLWCAQHHLSPSALHAIAEISATIIEKMHLFRPKFLGQLQGPPTYYSAYDFQHSCEFYPDEENLMENIILLEDQLDCESGVCYKDEFVTSGQFRPFKEIEILRNLIGQVQRDYLQETNCMEQEGEESLDEATSLCRYFQRGMCNKGSECQFSHDLTARRSLCKYFMTESGCRYGEMCEFRHIGSTQLSSIQDSPVYFEEDPPSTNGFLELLPPDQGNILVYGEEDFSFTWNLSGHYTPEKILATSINPREAAHITGKTAVKDRVTQLSTAGVEIVWDVELCSLQTEDSPVIPWNEIECVLWTIRREKNGETFAKRLLDFFSSLSVILLSQGLADITVLLTMYTDQYVRCQVERVARDCFFFLVKSIPFDMVAFGVYSRSEAPAIGDPKPVTYMFELLPPSALLHGDYFWHLQQAIEA